MHLTDTIQNLAASNAFQSQCICTTCLDQLIQSYSTQEHQRPNQNPVSAAATGNSSTSSASQLATLSTSVQQQKPHQTTSAPQPAADFIAEELAPWPPDNSDGDDNRLALARATATNLNVCLELAQCLRDAIRPVTSWPNADAESRNNCADQRLQCAGQEHHSLLEQSPLSDANRHMYSLPSAMWDTKGDVPIWLPKYPSATSWQSTFVINSALDDVDSPLRSPLPTHMANRCWCCRSVSSSARPPTSLADAVDDASLPPHSAVGDVDSPLSPTSLTDAVDDASLPLCRDDAEVACTMCRCPLVWSPPPGRAESVSWFPPMASPPTWRRPLLRPRPVWPPNWATAGRQ